MVFRDGNRGRGVCGSEGIASGSRAGTASTSRAGRASIALGRSTSIQSRFFVLLGSDAARSVAAITNMKTTLFRLACCLSLVFALNSCSKQKAKDIVVDDLQTVCDHVDAMEIVADEMIAIVGTGESPEVSNMSQLQAILPLTNKMDELNDAIQKKYNLNEAKACSGWDRLQSKSKQLGGLSL